MSQTSAETLTERIVRSMELSPEEIHELDFDDVRVSESAMDALEEIVSKIILNVVSEGDIESKVALFDDLRYHAYWVGTNSNLLVAATHGGKLHIVEVPKEHWKLKEYKYH